MRTMNKTRRLCGEDWQTVHPSEYLPESSTYDTCAVCGQDGLTYRSTIADEQNLEAVALGQTGTFALRFIGGPLDGNVMAEGAWPPPESLAKPGGQYVRASFSQLPNDHPPSLMRGAVYQWEPEP